MRLKLSSLTAAVSLLCGPAFAALRSPTAPISAIAVSSIASAAVNTFNPQKVSSGLIVDTLAAQIYDRLLDVDPYTYRLVPELAESWEVLDNGATYRFHLRRHVPFQRTAWFTPTRDFNADDVILPLAVFLTATIRGTTSTAAASPTSTVCSLLTAWRASASWIIRPWSFASSGRTPRSSGIWPPTMRQLPLPNMPPA